MQPLNAPALRPLHRWFRRLRFLAVLAGWGLVLYLVDGRGPLWPGFLLVALGQAMQIWAAGALVKNERVATGGPYAFVRNPMYLGRFMLGLGFALCTWRWYLVVLFVVGFAAYAQARVLREEGRLRESLGQEYEDYCRRVRRWLPRWPGRKGLAAPWSLTNAWRNGQLLAAALMLPIVVSIAVRHEWQARL